MCPHLHTGLEVATEAVLTLRCRRKADAHEVAHAQFVLTARQPAPVPALEEQAQGSRRLSVDDDGDGPVSVRGAHEGMGFSVCFSRDTGLPAQVHGLRALLVQKYKY
jgi:hypothetical protein